MKLVLASNSPRRKKILSQFELDLVIVPHRFNEESIDKDLPPKDYCQLVSRGKLNSIADDYSGYPVLSADTIVAIDENILEKPTDRDDALRMLASLSGREHLVLTAVNLIYKDKDVSFSFIEETLVTFNQLDKREMVYYIDKYKPYDKSGAYGIQDFSAIFVHSIKGCFFNVMGLPLSTLFQYFKKFDLTQFPLHTGN